MTRLAAALLALALCGTAAGAAEVHIAEPRGLYHSRPMLQRGSGGS